MLRDVFSVFHQANSPGRELPLMLCVVVVFEVNKSPHATILTIPPSLFLCVFLFLTVSGYHVSSSMVVEEEARWESRHLLQEVYDNESKLYTEPEKNCTEPGKTGWDEVQMTPFCLCKQHGGGINLGFSRLVLVFSIFSKTLISATKWLCQEALISLWNTLSVSYCGVFGCGWTVEVEFLPAAAKDSMLRFIWFTLCIFLLSK